MQKEVAVMKEEKNNCAFVNKMNEESPYGILVFNSKLDITDWNPAIERLIGLSKASCLGRNILNVFLTEEQTIIAKTNSTNTRGTLVVAESVSGNFWIGAINSVKISTIVDKSGSINGGTLIITSQVNMV
jgi:PAS domain-containing protein